MKRGVHYNKQKVLSVRVNSSLSCTLLPVIFLCNLTLDRLDPELSSYKPALPYTTSQLNHIIETKVGNYNGFNVDRTRLSFLAAQSFQA